MIHLIRKIQIQITPTNTSNTINLINYNCRQLQQQKVNQNIIRNNNNNNINNFIIRGSQGNHSLYHSYSTSNKSIKTDNNNNNNSSYFKSLKNLYKNIIGDQEMDTTTTTTATTSTPEVDAMKVENENNNNNGTESTIVSIKENTTTIQYNSKNEVFYNPVQEFNRDLSIMMIKLFIEQRNKELADKKKPPKKIRILEALSATGLRSIRYAKEIEGVEQILSNDIEEAAVKSIEKNRDLNGVDANLLVPNLGDATMVMYQHRDPLKQFDVIDVDPYGAPSNFLDGAVQAVAEGGLLCVTATDSAVLCGNHPEACYHKYSSVPLKGDFCHEMGIRILLHTIETHANRYKRHIVPVLSLSIDFYIRVFVRVYTSALECKRSFSKLANIYSCVGCGSYNIAPLGIIEEEGRSIKYKLPILSKFVDSTNCKYCTKLLQVAGPFWNRPIHDKEVCKAGLKHIEDHPNAFNTCKRMFGVLTSAYEELADVPFYFRSDHFTSVLHTSTPPVATIRSALLNAGYKVSSSHVQAVIKTNAPFDFMWDIWRTYAKTNPPKNTSPTSPAHFILSKEPTHKIDFTMHPQAHGETPSVPKYLPNPKENWGPGSRAGKKSAESHEMVTIAQKRKMNQGKYTKDKKSRKDFSHVQCPSMVNKGECTKGGNCRYSHKTKEELEKENTATELNQTEQENKV
ncbi:Probable N2,N2-dimethylguanosine tRNA methyltransferase [Heterostelium album PN500]|uniref:tRNA (guanine(26)-N(2))-dimethyltransferase n=1 Tax=Heterostelium pallidum (strain ATCC 26659 / Pp 5 / PN500) TaxID=670386 RepID=D3AVI8_HETP5|nr:Probable N2,N2-dimethylguanosine tRNA methyltransferase [Heterostelium album PN500]EFA86311.1 Probable N2,N2-dimethylguanosine tRNA methyltransferase [Heterostelium album PN500]|eukprot:XP_020438416.1 Probable N2,N2-dimethylguanosine tRNA methyltransferase [Heterostelium album PN500]